MFSNVLMISAGAVFGALGRYFLSGLFFNVKVFGLPIGILICNVLGAFLIGCFIEFGARFVNITHEARLFFATGLMGSFTTFSAFTLETVTLLNKGDFLLAFTYIFSSVLISIFALYFGMQVIKWI